MDENDSNERQGGQVSDISEDENDNNERQGSQVSDISSDNDLDGAGAQGEEDENIFVPFTQYVIRDDVVEGELASSQGRDENGDYGQTVDREDDDVHLCAPRLLTPPTLANMSTITIGIESPDTVAPVSKRKKVDNVLQAGDFEELWDPTDRTFVKTPTPSEIDALLGQSPLGLPPISKELNLTPRQVKLANKPGVSNLDSRGEPPSWMIGNKKVQAEAEDLAKKLQNKVSISQNMYSQKSTIQSTDVIDNSVMLASVIRVATSKPQMPSQRNKENDDRRQEEVVMQLEKDAYEANRRYQAYMSSIITTSSQGFQTSSEVVENSSLDGQATGWANETLPPIQPMTVYYPCEDVRLKEDRAPQQVQFKNRLAHVYSAEYTNSNRAPRTGCPSRGYRGGRGRARGGRPYLATDQQSRRWEDHDNQPDNISKNERRRARPPGRGRRGTDTLLQLPLIRRPNGIVMTDSLGREIQGEMLRNEHCFIKIESCSGATFENRDPHLSITQWLESNDSMRACRQCESCLIIAGTNDICGKSIDQIMANLNILIATLKYKYRSVQRVYVHEIINRIKPCWQRQTREEMMNEIRQYNERLHDMAPAYGYTVVTTDIKDEDLKNDGVHLNDTGV
ncbi:unnamed protein product, partial [Didymodactylos carnosus]